MESGEIINNSYKNFGDNISYENKANNPKRILKKIIIISSIITIIIATLFIYVFNIKIIITKIINNICNILFFG